MPLTKEQKAANSRRQAKAWYHLNRTHALARRAAWTAKFCGPGSTCRSYKNMLQRCTNPNYSKFHRYGGRLHPCTPDSWTGKGGLQRFIADVGDRPSPAHTLHRRCVDRGYSKSNAVWSIDHSEPCKARANRRNSLQIKKAAA
jgi:hypothetical protein